MLYRMSEWQGSSGMWYCNCVDNLAGDSGYWVHPARILGMTPAEYLKWAISNYKPIISYNEDRSLLFFCWENQSAMRRFKNYINAAARKVNYQV